MNRVRLAFESTGNIDLHYGFRAVPLDVLINYAFDIYNDSQARRTWALRYPRYFVTQALHCRLPGISFHARPGYSESVLARQVDEQVTVKNDDGSRGKKHLLIIHFGLWYGLILIVLRVASTRSRKSKEPWKEVMKSHERQSSTNSFDQQIRKDTKCQLPSNSVTMPISLLPPLLIKQVTNDNCSI